jgi:uncharacterized protein YecE (DUF72 family)
MHWVGTSGWQYRDWRGRLYPNDLPTGRWLETFAAAFRTVEVNNSFYRLPPEATFRAWTERTPADFLFAVKASRFITHVKRLKEPHEPLKLFWSRARPMRPKLGPVLFQMPPRFPADPPRLATFLSALPKTIQAAFEFRDPSWETDEVFALLDGAGAAFVLADTPGARVPDVVTGGWSYARFHKGRPAAPGYPSRKLARWADRLAAIDGDVFVYFNNDTGGAAVRDAVTFTRLLAERGVEVAGAREVVPARPRERRAG